LAVLPRRLLGLSAHFVIFTGRAQPTVLGSADHIIVANDNNLPFSSGSTIGKNDDSEFALLRVPELLRGR
jgi:hypothetical protein